MTDITTNQQTDKSQIDKSTKQKSMNFASSDHFGEICHSQPDQRIVMTVYDHRVGIIWTIITWVT